MSATAPTNMSAERIALPTTMIQLVALTLIWLVAGSTFGIWRGYDPGTWTAETFIQVHQGAVRGLNVLLPVMAFVALAQTTLLAFLARRRPVVVLYLCALALLASAGLITRFANQPINAEVMQWSSGALPDTWQDLREAWWRWHLVRTAASVVGAFLLTVAVFVDRSSRLRRFRQ